MRNFSHLYEDSTEEMVHFLKVVISQDKNFKNYTVKSIDNNTSVVANPIFRYSNLPIIRFYVDSNDIHFSFTEYNFRWNNIKDVDKSIVTIKKFARLYKYCEKILKDAKHGYNM